MHITRIEAKEFCQHSSVVLDLPETGIIGITGPNGSGKSNLVKCARFGMIGDSGNDGPKADDLNWNAGENSKGGSVNLFFKHAGTPGEVRRAITTARASLKYGDRKEKSVSTVNPAILDITGLPKKVIQDIIFVMQGELEKLLFEDAADRKKKFHSMFGIDKTEPLRTLLQRELADIGAPPSDDRLKELQARLDTSIDPDLRKLHAQLEEIDKAAVGDKASLELLLAAYEGRRKAASQMEQLGARLGAMDIERNELMTFVPGLEEAKQEKAALELTIGCADDLRTELARLDDARKMAISIERWISDQQSLNEILARPEPADPQSDELISQATDMRDKAWQDLMPKKTFVDTFSNFTEPAPCPTCGEIVSNPTERVATYTAEIQQIEATIAEINTALEDAKQTREHYLKAKAQFDTMRTSALSQLEAVKKNLESIGDVPSIDTGRADTIKEALAQLAAAEQAIKVAQTSSQERDVKLAALDGKIATTQEQLAEVQAAVAEYVEVSDDEATQARTEIQRLEGVAVEKANLTGQLTQLQSTRASTVADIERLEQQLEQSEGIQTYRQFCERARTLFHHDCLPMMVTQAYLVNLNAKLNEYLLTFSVPFTCTIKDDLSVRCVMKDGEERSALRLSGGEKAVLSIAFRFAVYSMFAFNFGFMVLDEPTAYLDGDRVNSVVDLLLQVRQYAHNAGMQLLVVTHEPALIPAFDMHIELPL